MSTTKRVFLVLLAAVMVTAGVAHFTVTQFYVAIMPAWLPLHAELVYLSGALEISLGLGLLLPATRRHAAWGLIALLLLMWPANINHALHRLQPGGLDVSPTLLWIRLPLQLVFIAWAWWMARPDDRA